MMGDVSSREGGASLETSVWEFSVLSAQLALNLKLL